MRLFGCGFRRDPPERQLIAPLYSGGQSRIEIVNIYLFKKARKPTGTAVMSIIQKLKSASPEKSPDKLQAA
jgi:hypothetical protein